MSLFLNYIGAYSDVLKPYSGVFLQIFFFLLWLSYGRLREPYSGVLELDLHKIEFYAIFFFVCLFCFLSLIGHNLILR